MKFRLHFLLLLFISLFSFSQNIAPVLSATGNTVYCVGTGTKIISNMSIIDPDDLGIDKMYIQISFGYVIGQDLLTLTGTNPNVSSTWDALTGKLTLSGISSQPTYLELITAIENIEFSNNTPNPSGTRNFSISVGQANYLPSTNHYYLFVPNIGVTWQNAKSLANASTYYGLQGYLATLTSLDEAVFAGVQSSGTGWIGATDETVEGTFKWISGPEAGTNLTFSYWNGGEPNNLNDEDYAHITAPGVGINGSWNDLSNIGESGGPYQAKGYVVEYGGMPGDPVLNISTNTSMSFPTLSIVNSTINVCDFGKVNLEVTNNLGTVFWYDSATSTIPINTGNTFTTPLLTSSRNYFVSIFITECGFGPRIIVEAKINETPIIAIETANAICENQKATIILSANNGFVRWYDSLTSTIPIGLGVVFISENLTNSTVFYAQSESAFCISDRIPIPITVNTIPVVNDEEISFCENTPSFLNAGISGMNYLWNNGQLTQIIPYDGATNYSVIITNATNCSAIKNFTVSIYSAPEITEIKINNLNIEISINGNGAFEYSLDNINFQSSNNFTVSQGGFYTCYVKEVGKDCGFDTETFLVLDYPVFFTPNNDGINDKWEIKEMNIFPNANVSIFDRYGKIVTVLNNKNRYWDGRFNGTNLPASDYWFVAKLDENIPEKKGHFTLKR